jgi:hypothetical protein
MLVNFSLKSAPLFSDPMKHLHLWQHSPFLSPSSASASASSSSAHQHPASHLFLFFNPPTAAQQELYFKTFAGSERDEAYKRIKDNWAFAHQWGRFFEYDPNKTNKHIPDPERIQQIKPDGNCLFR